MAHKKTNMNSKVNLSKIKQCGQFWDSMPACAKGRHCSKCNETIKDFRGLTDWEIAVKHSKSKNRVCGIYDENRLYGKENTIKSNWNYNKLKMAALVGILASSTVTNGQRNISDRNSNLLITPIKSTPNKINPNNHKDLNTPNNKLDSIKVVSGIIINESKELLIGVNVIIEGTENGTITDIDGKFHLNVANELAENDTITLIFQYIGFGREEEIITSSKFSKDKELVLNVTMDQRVELTSFGVRRLPWYKRIWNKIIH